MGIPDDICGLCYHPKESANTCNRIDCEQHVKLRCSVKGCPRTLKIKFDGTMPKNTKIIESLCPWHSNGDRNEEFYFDSNGNQLEII